jgi:hypothetical protein
MIVEGRCESNGIYRGGRKSEALGWHALFRYIFFRFSVVLVEA